MSYELTPLSNGVQATDFWLSNKAVHSVSGIDLYHPRLVGIQSVIEDRQTGAFAIDTADALPAIDQSNPLAGTVGVMRIGIPTPYEIGFVADLRKVAMLPQRNLGLSEYDNEAAKSNETLGTERLLGAVVLDSYTQKIHLLTRRPEEAEIIMPHAHRLVSFVDSLGAGVPVEAIEPTVLNVTPGHFLG